MKKFYARLTGCTVDISGYILERSLRTLSIRQGRKVLYSTSITLGELIKLPLYREVIRQGGFRGGRK